MSCIFCKIVKKEIATEIIYENEELIIVHDINPQAPVHLLIISKKHIGTLSDLKESDSNLASSMLLAASKMAKKYGIEESGFRFVVNCNKDGGQEVFHLHAHVIGGKMLGKMC